MSRRSKRERLSLCLVPAVLLLFFSVLEGKAQSIHVDAAPGHATNTIRPTEALGAGIEDRRGDAAVVVVLIETVIDIELQSGEVTVHHEVNHARNRVGTIRC